MGSVAPTTNTPRPDEEDSVPDGRNVFGSKISELDYIEYFYEADMLGGKDTADALMRYRLVTQWYEWCDCKYPGTKPGDWSGIASKAGEDVDIRLLTRGHSVAGYALLLFLEACYDVDKALCGTDVEALAKVKVWHIPQEMKAYKYLLSEEMKLWWATELAELEDEIITSFLKRVAPSLRIGSLRQCLARVELVMKCAEGIKGNIWTQMEETNGSAPPAGLSDAIFDRVRILKTSLEILGKALEPNGQGAADIFPSAGHKSVELGS
jgi:hypothetical protein